MDTAGGLRVLACFAVLLHVAGLAAPIRAQRFPVATRDIPRGTVLSAADLSAGQASATAAGDAIPAVGEGWVARRLVRAGEVIRPPAVAPPSLVLRGETVEVHLSSGGMQVTVRGRALASGSQGARVPVRIRRGWTVHGIVNGPGLLIMPGQGERN